MSTGAFFASIALLVGFAAWMASQGSRFEQHAAPLLWGYAAFFGIIAIIVALK